jgi:hypothetical protein
MSELRDGVVNRAKCEGVATFILARTPLATPAEASSTWCDHSGGIGVGKPMMKTRMVLAATMWLLAVSAAATDDVLYRFVRADGCYEITNSLPAEQIPAGYQIIDPETGRVLETHYGELEILPTATCVHRKSAEELEREISEARRN